MGTALDELGKHRKDIIEKKELKLRNHLSSSIIEQITTVWDMSAHISSWIVDGMPEEVSPELVGLVEKYFGERIANMSLDKEGELLEVKYIKSIMRAMTKSVPGELQTYFFNYLLPEAGLAFDNNNNNNKKSSAASSPPPTTKTEKIGAKEDSSYLFMRRQGNDFETIAGNGDDEMGSSTGVRKRMFSADNAELRNLDPNVVTELRGAVVSRRISPDDEQTVYDGFSITQRNPNHMMVVGGLEQLAMKVIVNTNDPAVRPAWLRALRFAVVYMIPVALFGYAGYSFYNSWKEQWANIKKLSEAASAKHWHSNKSDIKKKTTLAVHRWYEEKAIKEYKDKGFGITKEKDKETSTYIKKYVIKLPKEGNVAIPENTLNYVFPYIPPTELTDETVTVRDKFLEQWRSVIDLGTGNIAKWKIARQFANKVGISDWLNSYEASSRSFMGYASNRVEDPGELVHELRTTIDSALLDYEVHMREVKSKWSIYGVHDHFSRYTLGESQLAFLFNLPQTILSYIPVINWIPSFSPISQEGITTWADVRGGISAVWYLGGMGVTSYWMLDAVFESIYLGAISKKGKGAMKFGMARVAAALVMTVAYWAMTPPVVGIIITGIQGVQKLIFPTLLVILVRSMVMLDPFSFGTTILASVKGAMSMLWLTINGLDDIANFEKNRIMTSNQKENMITHAEEYKRLKLADVLFTKAGSIKDRITAKEMIRGNNA